MPAEPIRETAHHCQVIYVLPPWAERKPRRRGMGALWKAIAGSELLQSVAFVGKVVGFIAVMVWCLYEVAPELYRLKSEAGIDLVPGVHGPDVLPFLAGK